MHLFKLIILYLTIAPKIYADQCVKTVRWSDDPPFFIENKDKTVGGIDAEVAQVILQKMNCKISFRKLPWARALLQLENGSLDILTGVYQNPERQRFAYFSSVPIISPNILFVRSSEIEKWKFDKLSDILETNFKLGTQINVSYSSEYDELIKNPKFIKNKTSVSNRISLWKMLATSRIDGVIADELTGLIELKELGFENSIERSKLIVSESPAFSAFSKKSVNLDFVREYDLVLGSLIKDGTYKKIIHKYVDNYK